MQPLKEVNASDIAPNNATVDPMIAISIKHLQPRKEKSASASFPLQRRLWGKIGLATVQRRMLLKPAIAWARPLKSVIVRLCVLLQHKVASRSRTPQRRQLRPPATARMTQGQDRFGQRSTVRVTQTLHQEGVIQGRNSAEHRSTVTKIPAQIRIGPQSTADVTQAHDRIKKPPSAATKGDNCVSQRPTATKAQGQGRTVQRSTARMAQAHDCVGKSYFATTQGDAGAPPPACYRIVH